VVVKRISSPRRPESRAIVAKVVSAELIEEDAVTRVFLFVVAP
jgi:hypothetical protein